MDRILAWVRVASAGDAEARRARALGFADFEDAAEACGAQWLLTRDTAGSEKPLWHRRRLAEATSETSAKCLNARPDPRTAKVSFSESAFELRGYQFVGGYGWQPTWADGHNTGIYSYSYLDRLAALPAHSEGNS